MQEVELFCENHERQYRNKCHLELDECFKDLMKLILSNLAHDDDGDIEIPRDNYFGPGQWYCVVTITAPCGVVIAWTKFNKSESPTKILNWLQSVYPTEESWPSYICIDKGCQVLRTSIVNRTWESWQKTSRDYLCHKWCNPAPLNGSAPNLVVLAKTKDGREYLQRAFNT
ncbi:hypothetical protein CVT25_004107 [Psilocybe cyanescens]|uniref:Uncharacterized protein n=1 Tax=Psilocybe cyanescens TaxID=93625 RepID=A0A409X307_PSICY|nr:hypothetical protein CVT25_004107 [Psilocybe cyanescens]